MDVQELYSKQWAESADYFNSTNAYSWMCNKVKAFKTILEVGCGTGQSTIALLNEGHKVIAIEKNLHCVESAANNIRSSGYKVGNVIESINEKDVVILHAELIDLERFFDNANIDAVLCWNIGSYWDDSMQKFYIPYMIQYGLTQSQILSNPESSYAELIQWYSCKLAERKNVPIHLIDRNGEPIDEANDPYYRSLKEEFHFSRIEYDNYYTMTKSGGGRILNVDGKPYSGVYLDINLVSILLSL